MSPHRKPPSEAPAPMDLSDPPFPRTGFFFPPMHIRQVSVHLSEIAEKRKEKSSANVFFVHINRSAAQNSSFLFHSETVSKTQLEKL